MSTKWPDGNIPSSPVWLPIYTPSLITAIYNVAKDSNHKPGFTHRYYLALQGVYRAVCNELDGRLKDRDAKIVLRVSHGQSGAQRKFEIEHPRVIGGLASSLEHRYLRNQKTEEGERELYGRQCRKGHARTPSEPDEDSPWKAHEDNHHIHRNWESHPCWLVKSDNQKITDVRSAEAFCFCEIALQYRGIPLH